MDAAARPATYTLTRTGKRIIRLVVIVALAASCIAASLLLRPHPKPPPLEVSLWYWHQPFQIPPTEMSQLREMGVRRLFVRAGVVRMGQGGVRLTLPQQWKTAAPGLDIHLVLNFGYDVVGAFSNQDPVGFSGQIWEMAAKEYKRARDAGIHVVGIQLDLDCPTSKLPKYAEILRRLRTKTAAEHLALSATALPTWLSSAAVKQVAAQIDFLVPQFYEAVTPRTRDAFVGISSPTRFRRGVDAAGKLDIPFFAGAPAYGHALVYDEKDRLLGMFHDMGPDDAIRANGFHLERSFGMDSNGQPADEKSYIGEDVAEFRAPPIEGDKPYRLVYDLPTPTLVAQHLAALREQRPPNCLGVILFRYPERGERETVPLAGLKTAVAGGMVAPDLRVRLECASAPWEMIETGKEATRPPLEIRATATNTGQAATFFASDSVSLTLVLDRPGVEEMPPPTRGFDAVDCYYSDRPDELTGGGHSEHLARSSPARANIFVFRKSCLGPGESLSTGPMRIRADSATRVRGFWLARTYGGMKTAEGTIPTSDLAALIDRKHGATLAPQRGTVSDVR